MSSNKKTAKAKRQLAELRKRLRARTSQLTECFPKFVFDDRFGHPEFVRLVKGILGGLDFQTLPSYKKEFYRDFATEGFSFAALRLTQSISGDVKKGLALDVALDDLGCYLYDQMNQTEKGEFFPYNDVSFVPDDRQLRVVFSSLLQEERKGRCLFYSRHEPTVDIDGRTYKVAFSDRNHHFIERLGERLIKQRDTYAGLGSAHAFLANCVYFEPTKIRGKRQPREASPEQHALAIWAYCQTHDFRPELRTPGSWIWERLAMEPRSLKREHFTKPCYFRVGYCPVELVDEFAVASTLLLPGFKATIEYSDFQQSDLDDATKSRFKELAKRGEFEYADSDQTEFLEWLQQNSVPQLMATDDVVLADREVGPATANPQMKEMARLFLEILDQSEGS